MSTDYTGIPIKLTDAWADWVVRKLAANGETALTDEDIAAIIINTKAVTRSVIDQLISAGDNASVATTRQYADEIVSGIESRLTAAIASGDISSVASAKRYTDTQDAATLRAANEYTDMHSGTGNVAKSYVDERDTAVANAAASALTAGVTDAKAFATTEAGNARTNAGKDTDGKLAAYVSRETLTTALADSIADAVSQATALDADVLAAANAYTDEHASSGGGDSDYVDEQVGQARADLTAAINSSHDDAVQVANNYTDDAIELAAGGTSSLIDGKLADTTAYVDTQDAFILQQAKQYTDESGSGGGSGGVTQGYVDNGDTSTLASARDYADTKSTDAIASARSYTDTKAKPSAGWAKTDLASAVQTSLGKADTAVQPADVAAGAWIAWNPDDTQFTSTLQYRLTPTSVQWKGQLTRKAGNWPASTANAIGTLPAAARPLDYTRIASWMYGAVFYGLQVTTTGTVTYQTGGTAGADTYWNGISWAR